MASNTMNLDKQAIRQKFPNIPVGDLAAANSREKVAEVATSHGYSRAEVEKWLEENEEDTS